MGVQGTLTDFTNINKFNNRQFSNNLLFVGGILQSYDGVAVNEQNFHIFPEGIIATDGYAGYLQVGTYQYQVLYSWMDNFGQIQYGTPSIPISITLSSANHGVSLSIPTLRLTSKKNVIIQIFRTTINSGVPGTIFYEITSDTNPILNQTKI